MDMEMNSVYKEGKRVDSEITQNDLFGKVEKKKKGKKERNPHLEEDVETFKQIEERAAQRSGESFDFEEKGVPKFKVDKIPSGGISYPDNWEIHYTPMTFGEISKYTQMISQMMNDPIGAIRAILSGVECEGFSKKLLTYYDVIYLGHLRKLSTFESPQAEIISKCPRCQNETKKLVNFNELEFAENAIPELPVSCNFSFGYVEFGFFTVKDLEKLKGKPPSGVYGLAACVRNMSVDQAAELFLNAMGEDYENLEYIDDLLYHGISPIEVTCQNYIRPDDTFFDREDEKVLCGYTSKVSLEDPHTLVLPFREHEKPTRNKVQFGSKRNS